MANQTYINGTLIDTELQNVAFTYSIADIREPDKRLSDYSKTITIQGTKTVNKLFSHIYNVDKKILSTDFSSNFSPDFNPNLSSDFVYYQDGIEIFKGVAQLVSIRVKNKIQIEYDILTTGRFNTLFSAIGDKNLTDIDLSAYNHTYNVTTQATSWSATIGEGYVYPIIDTGVNWNGIDFRIDWLFPAIYLKQYVDKIFANAGYTYDCDFFDSTRFKRLIVPFNRKTLAISTQVAKNSSGLITNALPENSMEVDHSGGVVPTTSLNANKLLYSSYELENLNMLYYNSYSSPIGIEIKNNGTYNITSSFSFIMKINLFAREDYPNEITAGAVANSCFVVMKLKKNGVTVDTDTYEFTEVDIAAGGDGGFNYTLDLTAHTNSFLNQALVIGDDYTLEYDLSAQTSFNVYNVGVPTSDYFSYVVSVEPSTDSSLNYLQASRQVVAITEGDTVQLNDCIPVGIKQKDLLSSIFKHFNLYVDADKSSATNVVIQHRDDFYNSTVLDWTDKVDYAISIEEIPMGEVNSKVFNYKYKDDKDYYNAKYTERNFESYGSIRKEIVNDFIKAETTSELIYSTKPMVKPSLSNMNYPVMSDKAVGDTTRQTVDTNITVLYYGGLLATNVSWKHVKMDNTYTSYNTYPYCGHLDNPYAPTFDLSFGAPLEYYYTTTVYTSANCFNLYHKKQFSELSDINSKLIKLNVNLSPSDVYNLDFKKLYLIDGNYFRLNKVIDYSSELNQSTKVELIKTLSYPAFTGSTTTVLPTVTSYNLVQGGQDEIRDIGATAYYNTLQGGQDEVRDIGATSIINLINGGTNAV